MLDPETRRAFDERVRLCALRCANCRRTVFPPRRRCPACGGARFSTTPLSRAGVLENFTYHDAGGEPASRRRAFGVVRLDDGPRIACPLTGLAARRPRAGMRVILVVRRWHPPAAGDAVAYGYAAAAAESAGPHHAKDEQRE